MKTKRTKSTVYVALLASVAICFLFIPKGYSSIYETVLIDLKGVWGNPGNGDKIERSLPGIPITVYLFGNTINIQNDKPDCDITVGIFNAVTGEAVQQQTVPKAATCNINIPIDDLPAGAYRLVLTGPGDRYLEGAFAK